MSNRSAPRLRVQRLVRRYSPFMVSASGGIEIFHGCRRNEVEDIAIQWTHLAVFWLKPPHRKLIRWVSEQDLFVFYGDGDRVCESFKRKLSLLRAIGSSGTMRLVHFNIRAKLRRVRYPGPVDSYRGLKFINAVELPLILLECHQMRRREGVKPRCVLLWQACGLCIHTIASTNGRRNRAATRDSQL